MNKITENKILPTHEFLVSGYDGVRMPLYFDVVCGALSTVHKNYSTLWRTMPFHMVSLSPDSDPPGNIAVMRRKDQPDILAEMPAVLFMPADTLHRIDDVGTGRRTLWLHFRLTTVHNFDFLSHCGIKPFADREHVAAIRELIWKILDLCRSPSIPDSAVWLQFYGITMAMKLLEAAGIKPDNTPAMLSNNKKRLLPALKILENSFFKPSLETLASAVCLSPSRFLTIFREEMGCTPGKYYRQIQFTRACRMLSDHSISIAECSSKLGFADAFHFSREFHKISGISPKEYRKQIL